MGTSEPNSRRTGMDDGKTYSKPSDVVAIDGKVLVDGPDSVDVALTPEAAEETGGRLIEQAAKAAGQQREKTIDHRPK